MRGAARTCACRPTLGDAPTAAAAAAHASGHSGAVARAAPRASPAGRQVAARLSRRATNGPPRSGTFVSLTSRTKLDSTKLDLTLTMKAPLALSWRRKTRSAATAAAQTRQLAATISAQSAAPEVSHSRWAAATFARFVCLERHRLCARLAARARRRTISASACLLCHLSRQGEAGQVAVKSCAPSQRPRRRDLTRRRRRQSVELFNSNWRATLCAWHANSCALAQNIDI